MKTLSLTLFSFIIFIELFIVVDHNLVGLFPSSFCFLYISLIYWVILTTGDSNSVTLLFQFYPRVVLPDCLQTDPHGLRVGPPEHGHREQPQGLPPLPLWASPDAAVWPVPGILHDSLRELLELQLHGSVLRLPSSDGCWELSKSNL